jgi:hypothetical protein
MTNRAEDPPRCEHGCEATKQEGDGTGAQECEEWSTSGCIENIRGFSDEDGPSLRGGHGREAEDALFPIEGNSAIEAALPSRKLPDIVDGHGLSDEAVVLCVRARDENGTRIGRGGEGASRQGLAREEVAEPLGTDGGDRDTRHLTRSVHQRESDRYHRTTGKGADDEVTDRRLP